MEKFKTDTEVFELEKKFRKRGECFSFFFFLFYLIPQKVNKMEGKKVRNKKKKNIPFVSLREVHEGEVESRLFFLPRLFISPWETFGKRRCHLLEIPFAVILDLLCCCCCCCRWWWWWWCC